MTVDTRRPTAFAVPDFTDDERARAAGFSRRRYGRFVWRQGLYALAIVGVWASSLARSMATDGTDTDVVWNITLACLAIGWVLSLPVAIVAARDERSLGLSKGVVRSLVRSLVWGIVIAVSGAAWMRQAWDVAVDGSGQLVSLVVTIPLAILVAPLLLAADSKRIDDPFTVARLRNLIRRAGVRLGSVHVKPVSPARRENAFVAGVWPTRRLVLFDTLAAGGPIFVDNAVAHELGHARMHHVLWRLGLLLSVAAVGLAATVFVLGRLPTVVLTRIELVPLHRQVIEAPVPFRAPDPSFVPLVLLLWGLFALAARPLVVAAIRRQECAADLFGVRLTRDPEGFALLLRRLALSNLADLEPGPWGRAFFATHGSILERMAWVRAEPFPPLQKPSPPPNAG